MKIKKITRNLRYFVPLLLKINPMTLIIMVLIAIVNSINSISWVVFPKMIIEELFYNKNYDKLMKVIIVFIALQFITRVLGEVFDSISHYFIRKADFNIDRMFNKKITAIDYFHVEDPQFNDRLSYAKKCLSQYSDGIYSITWTIRSVIEYTITISGIISIILLSGEFWIIATTTVSVIINTIIYGK